MSNQAVANSTDIALSNTIMAFIALVRAKMRDYPELNRLTDGVESSDRDIGLALMLALDDYNSTPPLLDTASLVNFPAKDLLVRATIVQLLESSGLLQTRNKLAYSDGQTMVQTEQPQLYMQWWNMFKQDVENKKVRFKTAKNLNDAMGQQVGVSSEYLAINGFLDTL